MAKTIKFNLICDETPIRTIEDLQEHFSIEDVYMYYENGLLQRWLDVRGYQKELQLVKDIKSDDSLFVIKELIKIFKVSTDDESIESSVYILKFQNERKELYSIYQKNKTKVESIIEDYQVGYDQHIRAILENSDDVQCIKANLEEIVTNYKWAFELNHREFFWTLYEKSDFLAIMCLLMNEKTRGYFLIEEVETVKENKNEETEEELSDLSIMRVGRFSAYSDIRDADISEAEKTSDIEVSEDKEQMYASICDLISANSLEEKLGDNLMTFSGQTEGYWKDIEPKGKKYMIISMGKGDFVRAAGVQGGDLSGDDIKGSFPIIDGIDYKSNSSTRKIQYMEV